MECANSKLKRKNGIGRAAKNLLVISALLYHKVPLYGKPVGILKVIKNHKSKVFKIVEGNIFLLTCNVDFKRDKSLQLWEFLMTVLRKWGCVEKLRLSEVGEAGWAPPPALLGPAVEWALISGWRGWIQGLVGVEAGTAPSD